MTPVKWLRAHTDHRPTGPARDSRPAAPQEIPNFWSFLIHVTGEPVSWSGIAKLIALTVTLVLSIALLIGAAGWALHEAPLTRRADRLTTASAAAGLVAAMLAALKTRIVRHQVPRALVVRGEPQSSRA